MLVVIDQVETGVLIARLSVARVATDEPTLVIVAGQTMSRWTLNRKRFVAIEMHRPPKSLIWSIATHGSAAPNATLHHGGEVILRDATTLQIQVALHSVMVQRND